MFEAIYMDYIIANIISVTHTVQSQYDIKNPLNHGLVNTCVHTVYASNLLNCEYFPANHEIVNQQYKSTNMLP